MSKKDFQAGKVCIGYAAGNIRVFQQTNGLQVKNMNTELEANYPNLHSVFVDFSHMHYFPLKGKMLVDGKVVAIAYRNVNPAVIEYVLQIEGYPIKNGVHKELYYEPMRSHQAFANT